MTLAAPVVVATAAVELSSGVEGQEHGQRTVILLGTSVDVFLGGDATVTTATGAKYAAASAGPVHIGLGEGDAIWAICATSAVVQVLQVSN